jgi:hypothetical protein
MFSESFHHLQCLLRAVQLYWNHFVSITLSSNQMLFMVYL